MPSGPEGGGAGGAGKREGAGRRRRSPAPGFDEVARRRCELAAGLVRRRIELGLSQTEVGSRMGTSQSAVARIESGSANLRLSTLERYATALGMVIEWRLDQGEP